MVFEREPRQAAFGARVVNRPVALIAAGVLAAASVGLGDAETAPIGWRCPFRTLTGLRCPGCGGTRALRLLLRGKPVAAARSNLIVVLLALPFTVLVAQRFGAQHDVTATPVMTPIRARIVICVLMSFGVIRNAGAVRWRRSGR
jgi:Protein of unknown function (DUF2752)